MSDITTPTLAAEHLTMQSLTMPSFGLVMLAFAQALLLLALAPLATGFSRMIRARMHSRRGPGIMQDYRDIAKLLRRQSVAPANAGIIFLITPWVLLATMLLIALALPMVTQESPFPISGDLITDIYLLAIFRFFFALSGIDSNSMFAGIGSSRELTLGVLVEPILMLGIIVAALVVGSTDLGYISQGMLTKFAEHPVSVILAGIACAFAVFIEMGKLPFDGAEAEQELQEGPMTEYSGAGLALLKLSFGLKQLVVAVLFLAIFFPWGKMADISFFGMFVALFWLFIKLVIVFFLAGLVENSMARVRFIKTHHRTWVGFGIAILAFVFYLFGL